MKKLILLLFPLFLQAQDVPIGNWKDYLTYNSASYIAEAENRMYCVASGGLFYIDKEDNTINRMSKVTGLSDIDIKQVAYSEELNITIITYENCNLDLIKNNKIINISDVKRKEITGIKSINNITLKGETAYLSCSFGLVLLDLEKEEIRDTYHIGDSIRMYEVNGCALLGDSIITATSEGLFYANANSQTLSDYNNWSALPAHTNEETYDNIIIANNFITGDYFFDLISISYNNNTLIKTKFDRVGINKDNGAYTELTHSKFENIKYALIDNEEVLWIADSVNGILKFSNLEYKENYIPDCPKESRIFSLNFFNGKLYISHGGHINFGAFWNKNGASVMNQFGSWRNYDYYELKNARDIVDVAEYGNKTYFASYYNGVVEAVEGEIIERYSYANTNGGLDTIDNWQNDYQMAIADLKFDDNGNLWGLVSGVDNPIFVKTTDNNWLNFSLPTSHNFHFDEILIDDFNQKWGIMGRKNGLFVFNDNNTLENSLDDQSKLLNMNLGNGNLPSLNVYCFANDLGGEIWVGTDKGVTVFYSPGTVFSGENFDAQQILIQEGEYGQYLLSEETVKCITIDGANRKWIGTEKSGVFLLSEDGLDQILHFTAENSPLFSNNIIDIAINPENGEVFIGTEKGLISYRSDATKGKATQIQTHVFPNPVRESYNGPIAINGLISNANIKITDIDGNLVFEGYAKGGQAIWNGKNKSGDRASTGVYLVFSTDSNGLNKAVSKILFVH
tara:strand:- start:1229 stop:3436 length:2208 start_codon:yes stop_codon:yes gene_type:complete